jgi:mannose-6-phosphate isomerase-like protein (cupin superfamily)
VTFSDAFIVENGGGRPIHVLGDEVIIKVSSRDTGGAFNVFEGNTRPLSGPPLHIHYDQDECWRVLEGEFRFVVDGKEIHARAGDTVFAPRGSRHTFQNVSTTPSRMVTTVVPGGLDDFFEELEQIAPRGTMPDPETLKPLFRIHKLELLGPPLAAPQAVAACGSD